MWLRPLLLIAVLARLSEAQTSDAAHSGAGAAVSGIVRDGIARAPLVGAMVQLFGADSGSRFGRSAVSDSLGRFTLADVPDGRYTLGFFHPMLDSLGVAGATVAGEWLELSFTAQGLVRRIPHLVAPQRSGTLSDAGGHRAARPNCHV